jgi:hypothetical protein
MYVGHGPGCMRCAEMGPADAAAIWLPEEGGIVEKPFDELVDMEVI